jgi:outer membrane protein assembly factor BamD (BamD/ComL family)
LGLTTATLAFALVALVSCASAPPPVPDDASSAVIIQKAQDRSDVNDWKGAQYYYNILLQRFSNDQDLVLNAQYELAFIEFKQGNYDKARAGFTAILEKYSAQGGDALPASWKILSQKVLDEIPKPKTK